MGALLRLRVRLLGGLSVDGLDEREIGSRKGRTVLKLLAVARGRPVSPDRIVEVLWGDELPSRPLDQLGVLVSRLRAVLGAERLPRNDAGYALRYDWLDLDELEARVSEAERRLSMGQAGAARAAAQAALALARGPLLPDEEGEWVDAERAAADRLSQRARLVLAEAAVAAGEYGEGAAAGEAALTADPYDETALRAVMRAHAAAGRPASALAAYTQLRARLAEDLGVPPTPDTEALHDAIVLGDLPRPSQPKPTGGVRLVGRESELRRLGEALEMAAAGVSLHVVVVGEAGIGKSALLDAAAAEAAARRFMVIRCRSDVLGRDLPLQPLFDGLAATLAAIGPDAAAAALGPDAGLLEPLIGCRNPEQATSATVLVDAGAERVALFSSMLATMQRIGDDRPLLITVDDLHAADPATLEWLSFAVHRGRRLAAVSATRPARYPSDAEVLSVGPLDEAAAALLVGRERARELHARSGGNPLFLLELARSGEGLPASIRESVRERAAALGPDVARTLHVAAVLGTELDVDLLAAVLARPVVTLLDEAEMAVAAGLLAERGATYGFAHELVRDALALDTPGARRAFVHREAARVLAARVDADPQAVAWHARLGGDLGRAAAALVDAAVRAASRYEHAEAERLLDEAIGLADGIEVRLARARVRLVRWDLAGGADDADRALALGAGAAGLEVRGWIAYYGRDYGAAQRYADEGAERALDEATRASCLALAGRTRHSQGALGEAEPRLAEAAACQVPEVRSIAQVWLSVLRVHQGCPEEAEDLAQRALLEPSRMGHPFGRFHGRFAFALTLGMQGRMHDMLEAVAQFERDARAGDHGARFIPVALNLRSWPLRCVGRFGEAAEVLQDSLERSAADLAVLAEPRHVGRLDLAEVFLAADDVTAAARQLDRAGSLLEGWTGTMAWRVRHRHRLLQARRWLAVGDTEAAHAAAVAVSDAAAAVGSERHALLARCVAAEAGAKAGEPVDSDALDAVLSRLDRCAAMEVWLLTARLASACGVDRWWGDAERRAAAMVAAAGPLADDTRRYVDRSFAALTGRR